MNLEPLYTLIRKFEGLRLKVYLCPAGVPTIGYGHTGPDVAMSVKPITVAQAEAYLVADVAKFIGATLRLSPILAQHPDKLCAIADFCYNLGAGRYKASTLKRCVDRGDWEEASIQLDKWVWGGGKKLPGLVARRKAEAVFLR